MVYKFGGSSVRDAERMREVAAIICSFPDLLPVVVLSAMGKVRGAARVCVSRTNDSTSARAGWARCARKALQQLARCGWGALDRAHSAGG